MGVYYRVYGMIFPSRPVKLSINPDWNMSRWVTSSLQLPVGVHTVSI